MSILISELPESIAKEFSLDERGYGLVTRRGLARLCGVRYQSWGQGDSIFTKEIDEMLTQYGFEPDSIDSQSGILDTWATLVIQHYAFKGKKVAQSTLKALGAIGLRTVIQKSLGWEEPQRLTDRQIVEMMCLPVPTKWEPRFTVEFYREMSRLTGLVPIGNKRPLLWAKITKQLVYDYLPKGVYQEIKAWQLATDPNKKLHQYLSDQGIEVLGEHLKRVITLMQCSSHLADVEFMLSQSMTKAYQCNLFFAKK